MKRLFIYIIVLLLAPELLSQNYLSNLNAEGNSPIYTTYASALENTKYSTDQGYQLIWNDPEKGTVLHTDQSGTIDIIFKHENIVKSSLKEFSKPPVITTTYGNLLKLYFYPFPGLKAEYEILVLDSETLLFDIIISNESSFPYKLEVYPLIGLKDTVFYNVRKIEQGLEFTHKRKADSWMKEQKIPYREELNNVLISDQVIKSAGSYSDIFFKNDTSGKDNGKDNFLVMQHSLSIAPGEKESIRLLRKLSAEEFSKEDVSSLMNQLQSIKIENYIKRNESLYSSIPKIKFNSIDEEAVYWNAFNLMRQCMMQPEGKCSYNYYVFSREPKWGWGYGGQVFHESLTMLAYAYLDPISAMNSQRIYFERQHPNGYINYRTGPYLDEQIPTNGQLTSSAPWFNWQNYEIYKITNDKKFLAEAYESGKKFYQYYTSNRDSDNDGLCEWGAHAVLESVRDARVAVWDQVDDPVNFEALDCNLMLIKEAKSLSSMAEILGKKEEAEIFSKDAGQRTALINKYMWDEETGFYYHVDKKNHSFSYKNKNDLKRKEIIAFLALWSGAADKNQADKLLQHFNNSNEFRRKYGVPTLSADDPYYNPIGYWNGPIWLPWQYLVFRGLLDYGFVDEARNLTSRITENVANQLKTNHYFWEFYSADDLQAGWNKAYIWSGIIARFYIDLNNYKQ